MVEQTMEELVNRGLSILFSLFLTTLFELGLTDFCYTLDLTTYEWTNQVNVTVPTSVSESGVRYGHSGKLSQKKKRMKL